MFSFMHGYYGVAAAALWRRWNGGKDQALGIITLLVQKDKKLNISYVCMYMISHRLIRLGKVMNM